MKSIPKTYEEINAPFIKYLLLLAKNDPVPQPITELPLLDFVALHTTDKRYPDTLVVTHTHLLPNNVPFFRQLSALTGFGKIILLEKPYSTVTSALQSMILAGAEIIPVNCKNELSYNFAVLRSIEVLWHRVLEEKSSGYKRILIIDDGADVLLSLPWESLRGIEIVAVEQTQRGISQLQKTTKEFPPVVSVATCGIKKEVETIFIGENIAKKLSENHQIIAGKKIGIVGFGGIGRGVANAVVSSASKVFVYDNGESEERNNALNYCNTLDELIQKSDVVIGTTGKDALKGIALDRITGQKILISASSKDIEFYSILQLVKNNPDPFGTIELQVHNKLKLTILNGGYPFNFDRKFDATPNEDIVLTRSLLYIASMQALRFLSLKDKNKIYDLDQQAQEELLKAWIKMKNEDRYNLLNAKEVATKYSLTMEHKTPPVWIE